jgi:hypothetical protein
LILSQRVVRFRCADAPSVKDTVLVRRPGGTTKCSILRINSQGDKVDFLGEVSVRHSTTAGFDWVLRCGGLQPELRPPFLLTSLRNLQLFYSGRVFIELTDHGMGYAQDSFEGVIPVTSKDEEVMGVLNRCLADGKELRGDFTVFAVSPGWCRTPVGLNLCFHPTNPVFGVVRSESH